MSGLSIGLISKEPLSSSFIRAKRTNDLVVTTAASGMLSFFLFYSGYIFLGALFLIGSSVCFLSGINDKSLQSQSSWDYANARDPGRKYMKDFFKRHGLNR